MYNRLKKRIPQNTHNQKYLADVLKFAEEYAGTPINVLTYSKFRLFCETGSRVEYEEDYIAHRKRLNCMLAAVLCGKQEYLRALEDILCAICEEYTWALPAHLHGNTDADQVICTVDLFASETAFALSEILYLCGDQLCEEVRERIRHELMRRIVAPYMGSDMKWNKNNWSAVCIAGVVHTLVYLGLDDDFRKAEGRICASLGLFLDSYMDDGACREGALYWSYGFGNFVYAANLLREYTNGRIDYFSLPKVRKIAGFGFSLYLDGNATIPYSDGPHYLNYNIGLYHFLKKEYPELTLPDERYENVFGDENRYRYADFSRNLFWYDDTLPMESAKPMSVDYNDTQWYIRRKDGYCFSCKGGTNDEPHNHNDIGSFFVVKNGIYLLDDLGWPEYDNGYFNAEKRYSEYICAMSGGHGVPIVNGIEQSSGSQYRAEILDVAPDRIVLDISGAYDIPGLRLIRTFSLSDTQIAITDEISGAECVTERFVTRYEPQRIGNAVMIAGAEFSGQNGVAPQISAHDFVPRKVITLGMKDIETAYLLDYKAGNGIFTYTLKI